MIIAVVIFGMILLVITFMSPRIGSYSFWILTWWYPTTLLRGILPYGLRFDFLFLVYLALCCARIASPDVLASRSFRMAFLLFLATLLGNLIGLLTSPSYIFASVIREIGFCSQNLMVAYFVSVVARTKRDARRQIIVMSICAMGMCAISVSQIYRPDLTRPWETPTGGNIERRSVSESAGSEYSDETRRADVSSLAFVAPLMVAVALRQTVRATGLFARLGYACTALASALALAYSITRSATAGLAAALLYAVFRFRHRVLTTVFIVGALMAMLAGTDLGERWLRRVGSQGLRNPVAESASFRASLWHIYFTEWSPHYFLFGRGLAAEFFRHGGVAPHNTYIAAVSATGVFGFGVLLWIIGGGWRMARKLIDTDSDPFYVGLAEALLMTLIIYMVQGVTGEIFQQPLLSFFALLAMVDGRLRMLADAAPVLPTEAIPATPSTRRAMLRPASPGPALRRA